MGGEEIDIRPWYRYTQKESKEVTDKNTSSHKGNRKMKLKNSEKYRSHVT